MLAQLDIQDFAVVDRVALELDPGMTVLTGETGAGKSIVVDALSFVLGERVSTTVIRPEAARAEVSGGFLLQAEHPAQAWLREHELASPEGECILRRVLSREGRSRAYVNGHPVPVQSLRDLGDLLVDIHGQHAHQSLLRRETQRQILDDHAGAAPLLTELGSMHREYQRLQREMDALGGSPAEQEAALGLLRYQIEELETLALAPGELEKLDAEHARLTNSGRLMETCQAALDEVYEGEQRSAAALLESAVRALGPLGEVDRQLGPVVELLEGAAIQVQEAGGELRRYLSQLDSDPARLEEVELRLSQVHDMARKHRVKPPEMADLHSRLRQELNALEHGEQHMERLRGELAALEESYGARAAELSALRLAGAAELREAVTAHMRKLGMPTGRFEVSALAKDGEGCPPNGRDHIEFLVSANPGQPPQPLARVASGGELSRISLAIHTLAAGGSEVPTLVFDEVDVGVGGRVAEIVGRELRRLGRRRQVLCVTHLPQVASQGQHHLHVTKRTARGSTHTGVAPLEGDARIGEIARMLGGIEVTDRAMEHAREMVQNALGEAPV